MALDLLDYTTAPGPEFGLPADEDRRAVQPGDLVKLTFRVSPNADGCTGERMWVMVLNNLGAGRFRGILTNHPYFGSARYGGKVEFSWTNIIAIQYPHYSARRYRQAPTGRCV